MPRRNVLTAMLSIVPLLEQYRYSGDELLIMAIDIEKAYDRVCRARMHELMMYLGIAANPFYALLHNATTAGTTSVTGGSTLSESFTTSRGIK